VGPTARSEANIAPLPVRTRRQRPGPRAHAASRLLEPDETAPGRARAFVRDSLTQWGLERLTDDAGQIISEIISNAVAVSINATPEGGTAGPIILHIAADNGMLTMRALDPDPSPPPGNQDLPDASDEHGRGLIIVRAISHEWGWTPAPNGGKYVFATLCTGHAAGRDRA
jgi:anti-sigma regulatory factor (Ser/Thr protein kinase)